MSSPYVMPDHEVAEFIDLAKSANVHFDLVRDRLTMRASNPNWAMWRPIRHLLDEIGSERIGDFLRTAMSLAEARTLSGQPDLGVVQSMTMPAGFSNTPTSENGSDVRV